MTAEADTPIKATLVRGRYYDLHGQIWTREKPETMTQDVTPEVEAHLREHAVDISYLEGNPYPPIPKFAFSNDAPKAAPAVRTRRRVAACTALPWPAPSSTFHGGRSGPFS